MAGLFLNEGVRNELQTTDSLLLSNNAYMLKFTALQERLLEASIPNSASKCVMPWFFNMGMAVI
jgi:hypothetical protein